MTDYSVLKRLAEAAAKHGWYQAGAFGLSRITGEAEESFVVAASPAAVLLLIADNERLHESDQEATELCDTLSVLLGEIAVAVRGPEEPKSRHGFHDLPSSVKTVVAERDQLKAENERLRADYAGLARFNPEWDRVAAAQDLVREHMAMVVQLKAEIAGLKTGYEAYERVNAELKAEIVSLKDEISTDDKIIADRDRLLNLFECPAHGQCVPYAMEKVAALRNALAECANSLHGEMLQKFGSQLPDDMHPVTRREYERDMAEVAAYRAAMGKGEQP